MRLSRICRKIDIAFDFEEELARGNNMRRSQVPQTSRAQSSLPAEVGSGTDLKEKRNPAAAASRVAEKKEESKKLERKPTEDINASAEAFIKNFRQQLMIQRLQSLENCEQMLARGL